MSSLTEYIYKTHVMKGRYGWHQLLSHERRNLKDRFSSASDKMIGRAFNEANQMLDEGEEMVCFNRMISDFN